MSRRAADALFRVRPRTRHQRHSGFRISALLISALLISALLVSALLMFNVGCSSASEAQAVDRRVVSDLSLEVVDGRRGLHSTLSPARRPGLFDARLEGASVKRQSLRDLDTGGQSKPGPF